jgi:hypothetical protein
LLLSSALFLIFNIKFSFIASITFLWKMFFLHTSCLGIFHRFTRLLVFCLCLLQVLCLSY